MGQLRDDAAMKRYSIWVREHGSDHDVELCAVDSNPETVKAAAYAKRLKIGAGKTMAKYSYVRVEDHGEENT